MELVQIPSALLLSSLKINFVEALRDFYPPEEINSFFHWLTQEYLGMSRLQIALAANTRLSPESLKRFEEAISRLQGHEPIQYIVGKTEFYGLEFKVNANVLVPRPETEELVAWILSDLSETDKSHLRVLDIGTGSGCIAVALAKHLPQASLSAMDVSQQALEVAQSNARTHGVDIHLVHQDVLALEQLEESYDIIVSNPPYVRESERSRMQANVLQHEPGQALWVTDKEPLVFYEKITSLASRSLLPEGKLFFEINEALGRSTAAMLKKASFSPVLKKDVFGKDRMLMGRINR